MKVTDQITAYLESLPDSKRSDLEVLHHRILQLLPKAKLWFLDGKDASGKVVSNPNIGYGHLLLPATNRKDREFYQVGISANSSGISVFIMGLEDRTYLPRIYGEELGKANVSGYCIKFKSLKNIDLSVLERAIKDGIKQTSKK